MNLRILALLGLFCCNDHPVKAVPNDDTLVAEGSVDSALCHGVVLSYAKMLSSVDVSQWDVASVEVIENQGPPTHPPTRDFRFSSSCTRFVVIRLREETLDRQWMLRLLDATKLRQDWVKFHFVDEQETLMKLLAHPAIEAIKFKTAAPLNTDVTLRSTNPHGLHLSRGESYLQNTVPIHSTIQMRQGNRLNIADVNVEPYISKDRHGKINGGFTHTISKTVCNHFNLSCNHILAYKGFSKLPNGTWTGFMWDLTDGNLDIFSLLGQSLQRHVHVDFTSAFYYVSLNFYIAHPAVSIKWVALLYPFSPGLWALTGIVSALIVPILYEQSKLQLKSTDKILHDALFEAVWFPFATLLQIGVTIPRRTELLASFFMVFALIVFTAYNSDLMSYLTWPEAEEIPRTWSELAQMRDGYNMTFHYLPGFESVEFMKNTQDPDLIKIRNSMINDKDRLRCSFAAAGEKNTVCIQYNIIVELAIKKNLTLHSTFDPLVVSREAAMRIPMSMLVRHHSRHYEFWNEKVGILRDTGHTVKWLTDSLNSAYMRSVPWMQEQKRKQTKLFRKLTQAFESSNPGMKPFTLLNFMLASLILLGGSICGVITFIPEILYGKWVLSKNRNKKSGHSIESNTSKNTIQAPMFISVMYLE